MGIMRRCKQIIELRVHRRTDKLFLSISRKNLPLNIQWLISSRNVEWEVKKKRIERTVSSWNCSYDNARAIKRLSIMNWKSIERENVPELWRVFHFFLLCIFKRQRFRTIFFLLLFSAHWFFFCRATLFLYRKRSHIYIHNARFD